MPRWASDERARAAFVLILLLGFFFATPLARIRNSHYCFADFLQGFGPMSVAPGRPPDNKEMGDPAVAFLPWLVFSREQVRSGHLPLWNPYNGGGIPIFANYQSAVLSPFALVSYALPLKAALIAAPFLKLLAIGLFTFLFLRRLGLPAAPSLAGATAHMFGGYYVVWLSAPHSGTAAAMPAAFYFAERLVQELEAAPDRARRSTLGLAAALAAGLLAGHPETFYGGALLLGAFCVFRLRTAWRRYRPFLVACVLATAVAAVQLVPFTEYLAHSSVRDRQHGVEAGRFALPVRAWGLLLLPQALGNATDAHDVAAGAGSSFAEAGSRSIGAIAALLAVAAVPFFRRDPRLRFFLAATAAWCVYAWNPLGLAAVFRIVPGLAFLPVTRTNSVLLFGLACLAAFGLHFAEPHLRRPRGLVAALLVLAGAGAGGLASIAGTGGPPSERAESILLKEIAWFVVPCLGALLAVHLMARWRGTPRRSLATAGLVALLFLQGGHRLRDFNPTVPDRLVYPRTGAMEMLQRTLGPARVAVIGPEHDTLIPNSNLPYGISMAAAYDAMWVRRYDALYHRLFGLRFTRSPVHADERGLRLFGVEYVLTDWPLPNGALLEAQRNGVWEPIGEILPATAVEQQFVPAADGLSAVAVAVRSYERPNECSLDLRVEEVASGRVVADRSWPCSEVGAHQWLVLRFPADGGSRGRPYRLVLASPDARAGSAVTALASPTHSPGAPLRVGGVPRPGTLVFDHATQADHFEAQTALGRHTLYRYRSSPGRFFTVGAVRPASSDEEALALLAGGLDTAETALVSDWPVPPAEGGAGPVEVVSEEPGRVVLTATRTAPGLLVTTSPHFPGWEARVNGAAAPVLRTNYAFQGVPVPAGRSQVELRYAPASLVWGAAATLAGLLAAAVWARGRRP
jgi:hypothetical protein